MDKKDILEIIGTIGTLLSCITQIPQIIQIHKKKLAEDLSMTSYSIAIITASLYILFGIIGGFVSILIGNFIRLLQLSYVFYLNKKYNGYSKSFR